MTAPLQLAASPEDTLYKRIGPEVLHDLVTRFYGHVAQHPDLIPIFPADLSLTARKQEAFLSGFLGGPPLYHQEFGHPRLRARHLPFEITPTRARAWLACMNTAIHETPDLAPDAAAELFAALSRTAAAMVNTPEPA
ncbi:globin [Deinococcus psychrotolerans]|uniref:Globin n=1 Tax=Deinococcus psychrotolerans TaxID=2489213 RepID=A0A3G8YGG5_9DEIO|nr:globin [Deinococcus psychrotolerans]AZI41644.1 globin [Deinococcus psychrotolerans]